MHCDLHTDKRYALCISLLCAWKQKSNGLHHSLLLPGWRHHLFHLYKFIYLCSWADTKYCTTKFSVKSYKGFWFPEATFAHLKNSAVEQEPKEAATMLYVTCSTLPLSWPWGSGEKMTYLLNFGLHIQQIQLYVTMGKTIKEKKGEGYRQKSWSEGTHKNCLNLFLHTSNKLIRKLWLAH